MSIIVPRIVLRFDSCDTFGSGEVASLFTSHTYCMYIITSAGTRDGIQWDRRTKWFKMG
jgi:hypothetical protein